MFGSVWICNVKLNESSVKLGQDLEKKSQYLVDQYTRNPSKGAQQALH